MLPTDDPVVYRAARSKRWIGSDERPTIEAFRRRPPNNPACDENGLSVVASLELAVSLFGHGAIEISVAKLAAIGLSIVPDDDHFAIAGVPYDTAENYSEVLRYANAIIECCGKTFRP